MYTCKRSMQLLYANLKLQNNFNFLFMHLPVQPAPQLCSEVSPGTVLSHGIPYPISISCWQTETYKHTTDNQ